jgi:hypothetical protein
MSRTFRRKNFEVENNTSWDVRGNKTAGFYTHRLWHYEQYTGCMWSTFAEPTEEQYYKEYWRNHSESKHANQRSPGHWYRRTRMTQNRAITREELHKFKTIPDYEPMVEANPRSCQWDWS